MLEIGLVQGRPMVARKSREHWEQVVERYESSGLTQAAFCKQEQVRPGTFENWLYKVRGAVKGTKLGVKKSGFVAIKTVAAETTREVCRLKLQGVELTFSELPTPQYIAELVRHAGLDPR